MTPIKQDLAIARICERLAPGELVEIRGEEIHCRATGERIFPSRDVEVMITITDELVAGRPARENEFLAHLWATFDKRTPPKVFYTGEMAVANASGEERAEAFLRTFNAWKD